MPERKTWECGCVSYHCPKRGIRMVSRCLNHEVSTPTDLTYEMLAEACENVLSKPLFFTPKFYYVSWSDETTKKIEPNFIYKDDPFYKTLSKPWEKKAK